MIRHDLSHWPLVISVLRGTPSTDEQMSFFAAWTAWLDRGEPFATLRVFADADALIRPQGGTKEAKAWLDANRARIRSQVLAMATVVPPAQFEHVDRMNAEKLFGVPAKTFMHNVDAIRWVLRAAPVGMLIPQESDILESIGNP